jgi:hypothetical protein
MVRGGLMAVTHIHTYLVHPKSAAGGDGLGGAAVVLEGKLFSLLNDVYTKSDAQCNIDISFNVPADGAQQNPVRSMILSYLVDPTLDKGLEIATKLQGATDGRSGLGLLFLISGMEGQHHKIVISRFPADNGILAEIKAEGLSVEFLERVFMKSAHAYKAAAYSGPAVDGEFWQGRAVDRQIGDSVVRLSDYWIRGFLESDFRVTPAAGTRRLALALKEASRLAKSPETKHALVAAATLAPGLEGHNLSAREFQEQFHLPAEARTLMDTALRTEGAANEKFVFRNEEFARHIVYRSVELDSGAILTAENAEFDEVFEQEPADGDGRVKFSAVGAVVQERLRGKVST